MHEQYTQEKDSKLMTAINFHKCQAYLMNIITLKMIREMSPVYLHPILISYQHYSIHSPFKMGSVPDRLERRVPRLPILFCN